MAEKDSLETAESTNELPPATPVAGHANRWPWLAGGLAVLIVVALIVAHITTPRRTMPSITLAIATSGTTPIVPASVSNGGRPGCSPEAQHPTISQAIALSDLSMVSAMEGWAVGSVTHFGGNVAAGVILHYTNGQWQQISGNYPNMSFDSITMTSPTDGWIGGVDTSSASLGDSEAHATRLLYHYDGHNWNAVPFPPDAIANTDGGTAGATIVRMFSANDGWLMVRDATMVGRYTLLHYNGAQWQPVQTPFSSSQNIFYDFNDITATGIDDVWLAGAHTDDSGNGGQSAIIAHYHAGQWSTVANAPDGSVDSIAMITATSGWGIDNNRLLSVSGQQATIVALPNGLLAANEHIASAYPAPDGTLWLAGASGTDSLDPSQVNAFLLHRHDDGTWERIAFPYHEQPGALNIIAADDVWAIGAIAHFQGCAPAAVTFIDQGTILHWHGGQWSQVVEPAS